MTTFPKSMFMRLLGVLIYKKSPPGMKNRTEGMKARLN